MNKYINELRIKIGELFGRKYCIQHDVKMNEYNAHFNTDVEIYKKVYYCSKDNHFLWNFLTAPYEFSKNNPIYFLFGMGENLYKLENKHLYKVSIEKYNKINLFINV